LIGLTPDLYDVEHGFDERLNMRYIRARLNRPLHLPFRIRGQRHVVALDRGDRVLVWRAWATTRKTVLDRLEAAGLRPVHIQASQDTEGLLTVSTPLH
jgi:hypothetical protein